MGNFREISDARISKWLEAEEKLFDTEKYFRPFSHAHNLYINMLAERGAVGLGSLLFFLGACGWSLAVAVSNKEASPEHFLSWGAAFSAWFVSIVTGLANTTLHHEHALLSMVLLAGWLSWRHAPPERFKV